MEKKYKTQIVQIASVYIGAVIGAGFASGQEMLQFFTKYGIYGMYGLVIAGILHSIIGAIILEVVYEKKWSDYDHCVKALMGNVVGSILKWTVNIFLFVCYSAMIAGAGAVLKQQFGMPVFVGATLMMLCSLVTFLSGAQGFIKVNSILVPILCVGGVILGTYIIVFRDTSVFQLEDLGGLMQNWLVSAGIYVAYNTLTVVVVLVSLKDVIGNRQVARWGGLLGGMGLGILGLSIGGCTLIYYDHIHELEIPMLGVLMDYPQLFQYIYLIVLVLAMYTTAIANGYGVIENLTSSTKLNKTFLIILMSILGMIGARFGFSQIVEHIYPIFGYIGFFEIIMLIVYYSCMKWEHRRK